MKSQNDQEVQKEEWEHALENIMVYSNGSTRTLKDDLYPERLEAIKAFIHSLTHKHQQELEELIERVPENMINGYEVPGPNITTIKQHLRDKYLKRL